MTEAPTVPDHLGRFLDTLGRCLDEPELTADDVAARAYLSRFHFDRMASAALGEPPGAFRRRLLLERSAYALVTTQVPVLEIAVQAGYGSHEAYSRAFVRSYGVSPTRWRASPEVRSGRSQVREFELAAASDIHFQPPSGLRIPEATKVTDMNLLLSLVDHHIDLITQMIERLSGIPEEELDRPLDMDVEWVDLQPFTLRLLVSNLVAQEERYLFAVQGRELPDQLDTSVAGIRQRHAAAGPAYREFVANAVAGDSLADTFVMTECDPPLTRTFGGTILHVITFGAVRRTIALRALAAATGDESLGWGDPGGLFDAGSPSGHA